MINYIWKEHQSETFPEGVAALSPASPRCASTPRRPPRRPLAGWFHGGFKALYHRLGGQKRRYEVGYKKWVIITIHEVIAISHSDNPSYQ